jgi:hypothetical protein
VTVWPRVIKRGRLKGRTFESESAYRKELAKETGVSRYAQRTARAKALGYRSYAERRKTLKKLGGNKELEANLRSGLGPKAFAQLASFKNVDKETRKRILTEAAIEQGIPMGMMFARFYKQIDAQGLRNGIR